MLCEIHEDLSMRTLSYGPSAHQIGDLYLPTAPTPPVICLLHGGFWRLPWGREHLAPLAEDLVGRGFAVWNLEYRRLGESGGGWPGTLQDVGAGIDHLATLAAGGLDVDLNHVTSIGHSAGGQLALWCAQQNPELGNGFAPLHVRIAAAVGLAPVADLVRAYELGCGNGAVGNFLGESPREQPERYRTASPIRLLPLGIRQLLIHGTPDEDVPVEISRRYAEAATAAGDDIRFIELPTASHMDLVDPRGEAQAILCRWLG
jgi:acetyl esterase/lipase